MIESIVALLRTTNAHPYGAEVVAFFLSIAPVVLVFLFIIVAAVTWRYRTRKRHGPIPPAEMGLIETAEREEQPR